MTHDGAAQWALVVPLDASYCQYLKKSFQNTNTRVESVFVVLC